MKKNTNKLSKNDPYYIKVGKFKKKNVYDAKIDMGDKIKDLFLNLGKEVITEDQYLNIGFNHVITNAVNNEFKLESLKKYKKKK